MVYELIVYELIQIIEFIIYYLFALKFITCLMTWNFLAK